MLAVVVSIEGGREGGMEGEGEGGTEGWREGEKEGEREGGREGEEGGRGGREGRGREGGREGRREKNETDKFDIMLAHLYQSRQLLGDHGNGPTNPLLLQSSIISIRSRQRQEKLDKPVTRDQPHIRQS